MFIMSKTLNVDMRSYSDIELDMFVKELTDALNHIEYLSEPEEEYAEFAEYIDVTRSPIFFGYVETVRKSIDRLINTIYTEQELRSTLREELMKKLDAYTNAQLTDIFFTVSTDIAQHKDLLEMLSEEDGTLFKKDTENYIKKQERYLKLITDVIKKRNEDAENGNNNGDGSGEGEGGNNEGGNGEGGSGDSGEGENQGGESQGQGENQGQSDDEGQQGVGSSHTGVGMGNPLGSSFGMSYTDPDDNSGNTDDNSR